jgi:branched-subunit amino acid ABC-type transport system permease component
LRQSTRILHNGLAAAIHYRVVFYNLWVSEIGKLLVLLGVLVVVIGLVFIVVGRTNLPIGRLPGDILYRGKHTTFYFPLATSIVVSVALSLLFYLIGRFRH